MAQASVFPTPSVSKAEIKAAIALGSAIVNACQEYGPTGAPGGVIFAALQAHGCTLVQFERIMSALINIGILSKHGLCYSATLDEAVRS